MIFRFVRHFILRDAFALVCLFMAVMLSGQSQSSQNVNDRFDVLETQVNQILGIVIPDVENAMKSMVRAKAQSDSTTLLLINRINTLQNTIRTLESKAAYTDSINFQLLQQLMMIENKIVTLTRSFNELYDLKTGTTDITSTRISDDNFKKSYIDALSAYNDGNYEMAIEGFGRLVTGDPSHKLADNCQYWLGESYYALKNYKRAILEFEKVFQFGEQDKWDDAQLKLGICFQKIGNFDKARAEFQKLVDHYPGSEYYQRAQQYLRQL
ncbi:MAG: hypothetical protein CMG71_02785 [Candidatus Marinimicrobia bacterium]|nr:hypothetical protein [Candidatus Neomarinimicrobiota bacterium]|tara:strand:+ start:2860 stop:3663 length:804 start_codon:yes stop_codon:yes gene_type:complete